MLEDWWLCEEVMDGGLDGYGRDGVGRRVSKGDDEGEIRWKSDHV